ncbi:MAG TPA: GntR family transcriptional regulator [Pirellulales bacterium]|jgi:DNA-binding GntR family transcriptional regulator|nr:GntR family transcriptional regulator [Pirellulales bacterium]
MHLAPTQFALKAPRMSLADAVYEILLEAILNGRLAAGAELNAVVLAKQLDVSRTPVQEAIRRLQSDSLAVDLPGRKARVARFTAADIQEVYRMRQLLESEAAALASQTIALDVLETLRQEAATLAATMDSPDWASRALDFDLKFHDLVALASGNRRLANDIGRYRLLVRGFCRMTGTLANLQAAFAEHMEILSALETRNANQARAAMARHIQKRLRDVLASLA